MRIGKIDFNFFNDKNKVMLHIINSKTNFCYFAIKISKKSISWVYLNEKEIYSCCDAASKYERGKIFD